MLLSATKTLFLNGSFDLLSYADELNSTYQKHTKIFNTKILSKKRGA